MTILTALDEANKLRPNDAHDEIKVSQLMQGLEGDVAELLNVDCPEYELDTESQDPDDMELLMPYPYDNIYTLYLMAMIDLANEETALYENDMAVFNAAWARARAWVRRQNRPDKSRNWRVL